MKVKIFSVVLLTLLIFSVAANTFFLTRCIDEIKNEAMRFSIENTENAPEVGEKIFDNYKRAEKFLSLTVSHDDLADIHSYFTEMNAYLALGNTEEAHVAKSRLIDALTHLRRLSGFNFSAFL